MRTENIYSLGRSPTSHRPLRLFRQQRSHVDLGNRRSLPTEQDLVHAGEGSRGGPHNRKSSLESNHSKFGTVTSR